MSLTHKAISYSVLLLICMSIKVNGHGNIPFDLEGDIALKYQVINSNNATGYWSNYPSPGGQYYHIEESSIINVKYTSFEDRSSNFDMEIGNITLHDINETLVQDNLAFGYWSMSNTFGFRSTANWDQIKQDIQDLDGVNSTFEYRDEDYLGKEVSVILVILTDSFQNTMLLYEENSGLLLYGFSDVFGFLLEMEIQTINGNSNYFADNDHGSSSQNQVIFNSFIYFGSIAIIFFSKFSQKYR